MPRITSSSPAPRGLAGNTGLIQVSDLTAGIPQSLTTGGSSTKAVADPSTHTSAGSRMVWDGANWVDWQEPMLERGFLAWNAPLGEAGAVALCVSQTRYVLRIPIPYNMTITGIAVNVSTAGATLTSGQNLATLHNQAGTKQQDTADQSAIWTTAGPYYMNLASTVALTGGPTSYAWVSLFSNGTTPATFRAWAAGNAVFSNMGAAAGVGGQLTGANMWAARNGTAITASSDITPGSNATGGLPIWIGLY